MARNGHRNGYFMNLVGLKISPGMLRLIAEIDEFKGSWRTMSTLTLERLAVLKRRDGAHWLFNAHPAYEAALCRTGRVLRCLAW